MKIVRRLSDGLIRYVFEDNDNVILNSNCLSSSDNKMKILDVNSRTHEIVENVNLPECFIIGGFVFNDGDFQYYSKVSKDILQQRIEERCKEVNILHNQYRYSDVEADFNGTKAVIQFRDELDRNNLSNVAQAATVLVMSGQPDTELTWRTADNVIQSIAATQMVTIAMGVLDEKQRIIENAWRLKDALRACTDMDAVEAININEGWELITS